jgi:F-type H+-transporting ATPase subunit c
MQNSTAFTMAIGTIGPALAIGAIGAAGLLAMARNPENTENIRITMILAIAFAEAIAIYALVVALILKFA